MPGENPTEGTQDHKPETKANPRSGARKPRSSSDDSDNLHTEGDEPETDSTGSEKADESVGTREKVAATHRAGQTPVETKKTTSAAAGQDKTLGLAGRLRFRRRIKPRR